MYVVRDGDVIFYVGVSQSPRFRLCQHLGIAGPHSFYRSPEKFIADVEAGKADVLGCSQVGRCILDNAPNSLQWAFDIYEQADASAVLQREDPTRRPSPQNWYSQRTWVEDALIRELRPYLNRMGNPHERELPEKYVRESDVNPYSEKLTACFGFKRLESEN